MKPYAPESSRSRCQNVEQNRRQRETSGNKYALIKRNGKQFRRSLKTFGAKDGKTQAELFLALSVLTVLATVD